MADPGPTEDLEASYRAAGFGGEIGMGLRPALLVVDLVRAYLDPESPLYAGVEAALGKVVELVADARALDHPVVFSYVRYRPGGADGGWFYRKVPSLALFDEGSPMGEPPAELLPTAEDVLVVKQYPSAFAGTSLAATLTALRVDTVVVTGVSTSGCVRASAVDALSSGFRTVVVPDAVGDRDPGPHGAALFDLGAKYADLLDAAAVRAAWAAS